MVYINFMCGNGYCGCDDECYDCFEDMTLPLTEEDRMYLDRYADDFAQENAAGIIDQCIDSPFDFDSEEEYWEEEERYYDGVWSDWKIVSKEEYELYKS